MAITCKAIGNAQIGHNNERNTVRERPFLVRSRSEEFRTSSKEVAARGNDLHIRLVHQQVQKLNKLLPGSWLTEGISDFGQNPFRRNQWTCRALVDRKGSGVPSVASTQQSNRETVGFSKT
jgi:hypothetical protein